MSDDRLKSIVERIERLEEEQRALGGDKRDVYAEAKSNGFNPKALRRVIAERRMKDRAEIEADMDAYRVALGMAIEAASNGDMSLRKAAERFGVSKSAVHRGVPRTEKAEEGQSAPVAVEAADKGKERDAAPAPKPDDDLSPTQRYIATFGAPLDSAFHARVEADDLVPPPALKRPA